MNRRFGSGFMGGLILLLLLAGPVPAGAWDDETHIAIARAAGFRKWFNAAGADMVKVKAGAIESANHYVNNPADRTVTARQVFDQVDRYNRPDDRDGHLYGAIIASVRDYVRNARKGKYGEFHLAFCAHYIGDLSQPFHNTAYNDYNKAHHRAADARINHEVLDHPDAIRIVPIRITSEADLAREIAALANHAKNLGYRLEAEERNLTREEAYAQTGRSASLLKAVLRYARNRAGR